MIFEVVGAVAAALLTVLLLPLCIRPRAPRRPVPSPLPSGTQPFAAGDAASLAAALSECVRCPTVAEPLQQLQQQTAQPSEPFRRLHKVLGDRFPRAHTQLQRHTVCGAALLFVWKGRDASLRPVLLTAHQDVVPSGDDAAWTHPPFAGDVDGDGWLWGRGAVDDKCCVVCILAAVERLLSCGFVPERTVLLAFGCNEEVNADAANPKSAVLLARKIEEEGLAPLEAVLDEGGIIYPIPKSLGGGDGGHVAMVGIAEKGSACFRVAAAPPDCAGHSSMPPQTSAAGALAKAILAIEQNPAPSTLTFALPLINALKHKAPAGVRLLASWPRCLGWLLRAALSKTRATNALLRTTRSVTVISGGDRFNVLPATASAIVNARLMPGTSSSEELAALRKTVAHIPGVTVELLHEQGVAEATTTTKAEGWAWDALVRSVEAVFPGVPVSPFLCIAMTDSRFYRGICDNVLMLEPIVDDYGAAALMHNIDERIPIAALPRMANLYLHFIVETC